MKRIWIALLVTLLATPDEVMGQTVATVYVGGHFRRERPNTVATLRNSGFTRVILFNVDVAADGTLTTDGETICRDGQYVFADGQPHYADDVKALKTWPTGVQRIEICIGGWGNQSYANIRDLITREGIGTSSVLYRNFKALKAAVPEIDAVNNDDEYCYDVSTSVRFHVMMSLLGYKTTVAPYTNPDFWQQLVTQLNQSRPGACDLVMVQCYDGGAGNQPADWQIGDVELHAGRTNYQTDMETSVAQMQAWRDRQGVTGGFVWVYNDETWNLNKWASAINRVFLKPVDKQVLTVYSSRNYGGYSVGLAEGEYCTGQLAAIGIGDREIASFRLLSGYELTGYAGNDLTGTSMTWSGTELPRMGVWDKRISSLKVTKIGDATGIETVHSSEFIVHSSQSASSALQTTPKVYDLQGRRVDGSCLKSQIINPNRGMRIVRMVDGSVRKVINY